MCCQSYHILDKSACINEAYWEEKNFERFHVLGKLLVYLGVLFSMPHTFSDFIILFVYQFIKDDVAKYNDNVYDLVCYKYAILCVFIGAIEDNLLN